MGAGVVLIHGPRVLLQAIRPDMKIGAKCLLSARNEHAEQYIASGSVGASKCGMIIRQDIVER